MNTAIKGIIGYFTSVMLFSVQFVLLAVRSFLHDFCMQILPRVPFVNCCQFMYFFFPPFGFDGRIWAGYGKWDLIVSVPDHCLSFYVVFKILINCLFRF